MMGCETFSPNSIASFGKIIPDLLNKRVRASLEVTAERQPQRVPYPLQPNAPPRCILQSITQYQPGSIWEKSAPQEPYYIYGAIYKQELVYKPYRAVGQPGAS